jgi:hypothetical protein
LHEGEFGFQFNHRFATRDGMSVRDTRSEELSDPGFEIEPTYWTHLDSFEERLSRRGNICRTNLLGMRRVSSNTNERTSVAAILPFQPVTYGWILVFSRNSVDSALLCANLNSLVFDYCIRNKLSQPSIPQGVVYQIAVPPPLFYGAADREFILPRVVELTFTSRSVEPFARDLGYFGQPFRWDEDRRALLRAELDAWYARAYGLSRDDLRYILDPADLLGPDYPSETFRVLKKNEIAKFGEYRTQRLVLAAWDRQAAGLTPASELPVEVPAVVPVEIDYAALPDGSWTIHRPAHFNPTVPAARLLAAILAGFSEPAPKDHIGLIYAFASRPEKLTPFLQGGDLANWLRLVGTDAQPPNARTLQMPVRTDLPFADALTWLRSKNALQEDLVNRTWQRGSGDSGLHLAGWPEGRARFVHSILTKLGFENLRSKLAPEDMVWEEPKRA